MSCKDPGHGCQYWRASSSGGGNVVRDDAVGAQRVWGIERKRKVANDTDGTYQMARAACLDPTTGVQLRRAGKCSQDMTKKGHRNGDRLLTIRAPEGTTIVSRLQVRDTEERLESRLAAFPFGVIGHGAKLGSEARKAIRKHSPFSLATRTSGRLCDATALIFGCHSCLPNVHGDGPCRAATGLMHHRTGREGGDAGQEVYEYDASSMMIYSVDLPLASQVTRASHTEPYLFFRLDLDPQKDRRIGLEGIPARSASGSTEPRRVRHSGDPGIFSAATRLVELMAQPQMMPNCSLRSSSMRS